MDLLLKNKRAWKFSPYEYASSKFLVESSANTNAIILAMVTGGRVINEDPYNISFDHGADIDIAGAYGRVMEDLTYPIGIPHYIKYTPNQIKTLTLGQFFDKYGHNLNNNNFKVVVSGTLTFMQDIIYSCLIGQEKIKNKTFYYDPDEPKSFNMGAPSMMLTNEITNGTITRPLWSIIKKIATNQELKEIKNLTVQAALYWRDSDCELDLETFLNGLLSDKGEYTSEKDTRTKNGILSHWENL